MSDRQSKPSVSGGGGGGGNSSDSDNDDGDDNYDQKRLERLRRLESMTWEQIEAMRCKHDAMYALLYGADVVSVMAQDDVDPLDKACAYIVRYIESHAAYAPLPEPIRAFMTTLARTPGVFRRVSKLAVLFTALCLFGELRTWMTKQVHRRGAPYFQNYIDGFVAPNYEKWRVGAPVFSDAATARAEERVVDVRAFSSSQPPHSEARDIVHSAAMRARMLFRASEQGVLDDFTPHMDVELFVNFCVAGYTVVCGFYTPRCLWPREALAALEHNATTTVQ
jgi:hypothetical protein